MGSMGAKLFPAVLYRKYMIDERDHASAILKADFPSEFADIVACLKSFRLKKSAVSTPGGARSMISKEIDDFLFARGWKERAFDTKIVVD